MPCPICDHPQRQEIDRTLLAGSVTLAALSQQYGFSPAAFERHRAHLQAKVNQAKEPLQNNLRQGCLFWLTQALQMTMQTAQAAQAESNFKLVLQAISQGTRIAGIILKQDCQLAPEVVYEILTAPPDTAPDSLLPLDPHILTASRQALAAAFTSPCPDTPAELPASSSAPDLRQDNFPGQAQKAAQPKTGNRKPETENPLFQPPEKGGKMPGQSPLLQAGNGKNQVDELYEQIADCLKLMPPNWFAGPEPRDPKLEALFAEEIPKDRPLSEYLYEQSLQEDQDKKAAGQSAPTKPKHPAKGSGGPCVPTPAVF